MKYSEGYQKFSSEKGFYRPKTGVFYSVAKEMGISPITIQSWLSKLKDGTLSFEREGPDPTPSQRGFSEKFKLLVESKSLSDENLGEWLRQHGLHSEHLVLWEQELEGVVTNKQQDLKHEIAALKKKSSSIEEGTVQR